MSKLRVEQFVVKIDELTPTENNPRQISKQDFENLKKSMKEFPEMREIRKVVVDENNRILGGHMRIKALNELGESEVPVDKVYGLTDKQKERFVIQDNIQNGEWDWDKLANEWEVDELNDWGLTNIKKSIKDEKEIKEEKPSIIASFITFDYEDEIQLEVTDDTAIKLMEEMIEYRDDKGKYDGFWDERLK